MKTLILVIFFFRRQWCRVAKHKWENTGIFGAREGSDKYEPVPQCTRCRGLKWKPKIAVQL